MPPRDIRKYPRSMYVRVPQSDGAICCKNRKIVPYHRKSPNTSNVARLRSPSPIMAKPTFVPVQDVLFKIYIF